MGRRLDELDIYGAASALLELVDGLSNWYVRRSRSRFWAPAGDPGVEQDKIDASFTLFEALVTITQMIAPFVPFFADGMYQNLVRKPWPTSQALSVHLSAFPEPDVAAIDEPLADEMAAVRELVSLGLQVRTDNKLKVRQPLARADVVVSDASIRERIQQYEALVREELNVHEIRWLEPGQEGQAVGYELKPNFRALGPRLGKKVQQVKKQLAEADASVLRSELASTGAIGVQVDGEQVALDASEVQVAVVAADGFAAAGGRTGVVVLHTALSDALLDEGLGREILAKVQGHRKQLDLGYTDRIVLEVRGSERVQRVMEAERERIANEALCSDLQVGMIGAEASDDAWQSASIQQEPVAIRVTVSE